MTQKTKPWYEIAQEEIRERDHKQALEIIERNFDAAKREYEEETRIVMNRYHGIPSPVKPKPKNQISESPLVAQYA